MQAEGASAFSDFHLYVCIAFLVRWSEQLRSMEFQVRSASLSASKARTLNTAAPTGDHHLPAIAADGRLARKGYRAPAVRSLHVVLTLPQRVRSF